MLCRGLLLKSPQRNIGECLVRGGSDEVDGRSLRYSSSVLVLAFNYRFPVFTLTIQLSVTTILSKCLSMLSFSLSPLLRTIFYPLKADFSFAKISCRTCPRGQPMFGRPLVLTAYCFNVDAILPCP